MAQFSKLGYGNADDVDTAIANGILDGKDIVITRDSSEFIYIRDDKTKQVIRPRTRRFSSADEAIIALNTDDDSYAGQTVMILDEHGKYSPYIVQRSKAGQFIVEPFGVSQTSFVWKEF